MMKKKKQNLLMLLSILLLLFLMPKTDVYATTNNVSEKVPFAVKVVPNEALVTENHSYLSLKSTNKKKQTVQLLVMNRTAKDIKVYIEPTNALTIKNGGVDYVPKDKTASSFFLDEAYQMKERIQVEKEVYLQAYEEKVIPVEIDIPSNKGTSLGGLLFTSDYKVKQEIAVPASEGATFQILNETAIAMAVEYKSKVQETAGAFHFGEVEVGFTPSGALVHVWMKNDDATVRTMEKISYAVYDKWKKRVFKGTYSAYKMAPKTASMYPISWEGKLNHGKYTIVLQTKINGENVKVTKPFTIEKESFNQFKKQDNQQNVVYIWFIPWWVWLIIASLIGSLLLAFLVIKKKNRKKKEEKKHLVD